MQFGAVLTGNNIPARGLEGEVRLEYGPLSFQMTESPIKWSFNNSTITFAFCLGYV